MYSQQLINHKIRMNRFMAILNSKIIQFNLDNAVSLVNIVDPLEGKKQKVHSDKKKKEKSARWFNNLI